MNLRLYNFFSITFTLRVYACMHVYSFIFFFVTFSLLHLVNGEKNE